MSDVAVRVADADDLPTLLAVQRAHDIGWFGAVEHDEGEVRGTLDVTDRVALVSIDGTAVAFAAQWPQGAEVFADPTAALADAYPVLLSWLREHDCPEVQFFAGDERLLDALAGAGWTFSHSIHDLSRPVSELTLPAPQWPDGVELRPFDGEQAAAVHRMIYDDAGWADVVGHHGRTLAEWTKVFLDANEDPPVVVWRADRPVAAAVTARQSSGEGHIEQIAVSRSERRNGLGRALLLEAFRQLAAHDGVTSLGLQVIATNVKALDLYLNVGLQIHREHQAFLPPTS